MGLIYGPKRGVAFSFRIPLVTSGADDHKSGPTLATGDFKVDIDGAGLNNLGTLPTNSPAASRLVLFPLSAAEMDGTVIYVQAVDQTATKEWKDTAVCIITQTQDVQSLQDLSSLGVQTALTSQGLTTTRAGYLDNLTNLDSAISTRAVTADVTSAQAIIQGDIAALNDLDSADITTATGSALTAQGLTTTRAGYLDNLDAAVSTRATPTDVTEAKDAVQVTVSGLDDLSVTDVQTALTNQGLTTTRATKLDNLDAAISTSASSADVTAAQAAIQSDIAGLNDLSTTDISGISGLISERVRITFSYSPDTATGVIFAEKGGVVNVAVSSVVVSVYKADGTLVFTVTDTAPDANGVFTVTKTSPGFVAGNLYYVVATITKTVGGTIQGVHGMQFLG